MYGSFALPDYLAQNVLERLSQDRTPFHVTSFLILSFPVHSECLSKNAPVQEQFLRSFLAPCDRASAPRGERVANRQRVVGVSIPSYP